MKQGQIFIHTKWLDEDYKPLRCCITKISRGCVYWRPVSGGAPMYFAIENADQYMRQDETKA